MNEQHTLLMAAAKSGTSYYSVGSFLALVKGDCPWPVSDRTSNFANALILRTKAGQLYFLPTVH
jgi:hypothetical protein